MRGPPASPEGMPTLTAAIYRRTLRPASRCNRAYASSEGGMRSRVRPSRWCAAGCARGGRCNS